MVAFLQAYWPALMWVLAAVIAAIIEAETCDMVSIWFVPGAIVAMLLSFLSVPLWVQGVVFAGLSAVTLTVVHTALKKYLPKKGETKTNVDALVGTRGIVLEDIDNLKGTGCVKLQSLEWTARAKEEDLIIPKGSVVYVADVQGVKLICQTQDPNQTAET